MQQVTYITHCNAPLSEKARKLLAAHDRESSAVAPTPEADQNRTPTVRTHYGQKMPASALDGRAAGPAARSVVAAPGLRYQVTRALALVRSLRPRAAF